MSTPPTRACSRCGEQKPEELFVKAGEKRRAHCKSCASKATGDNYSRLSRSEKERIWDRWQNRKFGLAPGAYDEMLKYQGGVCAICKGDEIVKSRTGEVRRLAIDHCHATGKVRGLLCSSCNQALGKFYDNTQLLRAAANYLERSAATIHPLGS